jgi:hypothetical protein
MTVFRSKTFKKNRPSRIQRKLWRGRVRRTVRRRGSKGSKGSKGSLQIVKHRRQDGGYIPYRGNPKGGVTADLLDWDDQTEKGT